MWAAGAWPAAAASQTPEAQVSGLRAEVHSAIIHLLPTTLMLKEIDRKRLLVPVPWPVASLLASVLQFAPGKPLTPDQLRQLRVDNVVSEAAIAEKRTLAGLGIDPTSLAAILPSYLVRFRPRGRFERQRPA